ncbi:sigma factor-like helix-turn-helix DNA-binding protein [Burkholderia contaminans]|uniref:sigma factor-like helix-turn-helix DNA-binding protein n=1 Tax=Burkholderia contaminans TaxID=488447 RepID=UPI003D67218F
MSYESDLLVWLPHLTRYARALTGDRAWADDLVQDTLERALQTMAAPAGEIGGLVLRDVQRALYRLPVEQREVLLLVALEELSYRDAAAVLGVPVGTVMSRLARARGQMRVLLSDEPPAHGTAALRVIGKT